jgi:iron-sulfur cluster assembly protein
MIRLTSAAAEQIRESAKQGGTQGLALRLAVTRTPESRFHYAMGFDDTGMAADHRFSSQDIEIVVSNESLALLEGTVVDYVELEPGRFHFIFLNPNDPDYEPPKAGETGSAEGP